MSSNNWTLSVDIVESTIIKGGRILHKYTDKTSFFQGLDPFEILEQYGSPLYVYNERILRENCAKMKNLVDYPNFKVNYSVKANSNLHLLEIIRQEGLSVDAMSPGEIFVELAAGFSAEQILYICNNVSSEEMRFAVEHGILTSLDSLSQLETFGRNFPNTDVVIRINPDVGAGHHSKVTTGGKNTKFGIDNTQDKLSLAIKIANNYNLRIVGLNQHIGSLFMDGDSYLLGARSMAEVAKQFESLELIDLGGGFGVPYRKLSGESPLDLQDLGRRLGALMSEFANEYGSQLQFKIEPGRFVCCESGVLLGTVNSVKDCYGTKYVGTDIGFNVLARPMMYDAHHDIEVHSKNESHQTEVVSIVGNICETGDVLAKDRELQVAKEGDILCVLDAGAYGMSMASNYNMRLRPAELLICEDGTQRLIRHRDTLDGLLTQFPK